MASIPSQTNFPTPNQVPDHSIMDINGKQAYLGNQFNFPVSGFATTTSEANMVLVSNPATAKRSLVVKVLKVSSVGSTSQFKFYMNPTGAAAGTLATPVNSRFASGTTSVALCSTAPTSSAKGTLSQTLECGTGSVVTIDYVSMMILDPGVSMLVTVQSAAATTASANICWYEI